MSVLRPPAPIDAAHDVSGFDCGVATLDTWLKRRALSNHVGGASRSYVAASGNSVVAYYCLASGGIMIIDAPSPVRRNMPDPIPIAVLGRLAVDRSAQGRGLGTAMLQDAVKRTMQAAAIIGIRGLLVNAISEDARRFYLRYGFVESPTNPMTLVLSLKVGR